MSTRMPAADSDSHLMTIALTARLGQDRDVRPLSPKKYWEAERRLEGRLIDAASDGDQTTRSLAERRSLAALHGAELESQGIQLLTPFHELYPSRFLERLGTNAPPLLYVAGDPALLASGDRQRLGVVGSRDANETQLALARDAAAEAAAHSWDVVSGGAKGVDAMALNAAADAGCLAIAILSDGVRRALRKGALRRLVSEGRAILVSAVHPDAGFSVGSAMGRNKLIYALADVTFVVAASEGSGGTWAGATEALRRGYGCVAVSAQVGGRVSLLEQGGFEVTEVQRLFQSNFTEDSVRDHEQLDLFG